MTAAPLRDIEALPVLLFEGERYAHKFVVHPAPGITFAGMAVTARFITADETEEEIVAPGGQVVDGAAVVTLTPACYTVPGHFKFYIYVKDNTKTVCVYACTGVVIPTVGANGTAGTSAGVIIEAYTAGAPLLDSLIPGKTAAFSDSESAASGQFSVAIGSRLEASGDYSQAFGAVNKATAECAHVEGANNEATGRYSHAEGRLNYATEYSAHAEGISTQATGSASHAEGHATQATGPTSHAEGFYSVASGVTSHAEGTYTVASESDSHAEGSHTVASGLFSHAEGYYTVANQSNQHVFGRYNATPSGSTAYLELVGNGNTENTRSNARTLDSHGNEALAGSLTLDMNMNGGVTLSANELRSLLLGLNILSLNRLNLTSRAALERLVNMLENWTGGSFGDNSGSFGSDHIAVQYVDPPFTGLITFTKQPSDKTVQEGKLTVFEVGAEDVGSYQWMYSPDGASWIDCGSDFTGPKTSRLLTAATAAMNGWRFTCKVTGTDGTIVDYSQVATLTVTAAS